MVLAMKRLIGVVALILLGVAAARTVAIPVRAQNPPPAWTAQLNDVRAFAAIIHTPLANELAPKTILTRTQVQTLMTNPQMPEIRLTEEKARRYIVVDYDKYLPLAPGIAVIKAPGHTPGSQMVFVALESGKEYLLIGD